MKLLQELLLLRESHNDTTNVMFIDDREARQDVIDKFKPKILGSYEHLKFKSKADYDAAAKFLDDLGHKAGSHYGQSDGEWDSDMYVDSELSRAYFDYKVDN